MGLNPTGCPASHYDTTFCLYTESLCLYTTAHPVFPGSTVPRPVRPVLKCVGDQTARQGARTGPGHQAGGQRERRAGCGNGSAGCDAQGERRSVCVCVCVCVCV